MVKNMGTKINKMLGMISVVCMGFALSFSFYVVHASDPPPLQDFCVGINDVQSSVFINGKFCKNPKQVTINDFIFKGFNVPGNTSSTPLGATALLVSDSLFPAVNTLGISIGRIDFGPFGLNTPHLHPLASEIFAVTEGTLYVGFITTDNTLYDAIIKAGDVIVFPQGLIHFQLNVGTTNALAIAGFGGQNPGRTNIADALFGSKPSIVGDVLTKAFQVNDRVIQKLQNQFTVVGDDDGDDYDDVSVETGRSLLKLLSEST